MSDVEQKWEYEFTGYVVDLDSAYAYALEKNSGELEPISQKIVSEVLPKLLDLIKQKEEDAT